MNRIGDTYHTTSDTDAARDVWQQALTILDDLDADHIRSKLATLDEPHAAAPG